MTYLLDTCTVSDFVKGDQNTIKRLSSEAPFSIKVSAITAYELRYGLQKKTQIKKSIENAVLSFLEEVEVLEFNNTISIYAAKTRANLENTGTPIGPYDILIAATALANDIILVTSNTKEFSRISDLKIEDWRGTSPSSSPY